MTQYKICVPEGSDVSSLMQVLVTLHADGTVEAEWRQCEGDMWLEATVEEIGATQ